MGSLTQVGRRMRWIVTPAAHKHAMCVCAFVCACMMRVSSSRYVCLGEKDAAVVGCYVVLQLCPGVKLTPGSQQSTSSTS